MKLFTEDIHKYREALLQGDKTVLGRVHEAKLIREVELLRWLVLLLFKTIIKIERGKATPTKALEVLQQRVIDRHQVWFDDLLSEPEYREPE